jgi:hypothetical protein
MGFLFPLLAIVAGILAASSLVIKKLPDSANIIQKIKPYEAGIGAAALAMGLMTIFSVGRVMRQGILVVGMTWGCIASCIIMGFLLGYPLLQEWLLDELSEEAKAKSEQMYERLTPYKVTAGLVGIGTGLFLLIP